MWRRQHLRRYIAIGSPVCLFAPCAPDRTPSIAGHGRVPRSGRSHGGYSEGKRFSVRAIARRCSAVAVDSQWANPRPMVGLPGAVRPNGRVPKFLKRDHLCLQPLLQDAQAPFCGLRKYRVGSCSGPSRKASTTPPAYTTSGRMKMLKLLVIQE
jgi:hypothetical protein